MTWLEALILGLVQGFTEFLPVSSSGHLEIGKAILGVNPEKSLIFTVLVHCGTVFSTIVVFRKELLSLAKDVFAFRWNDSVKYIVKLIVSMIPVIIIGYFFLDEVESLFNENLVLVGSMLILTSILLASTYLIKSNNRSITYLDAFIIGISQMIAVLPGLSRSGATISTGLLLGNKREEIAKFSFLMVLVPVIGASLKDLMDSGMTTGTSIGAVPLLVGFISSFIAGLFACKWMIGIVKKGNLIYFSVYCLIIGVLAIIFA
jgi:undecaprenyl-diphosphatase